MNDEAKKEEFLRIDPPPDDEFSKYVREAFKAMFSRPITVSTYEPGYFNDFALVPENPAPSWPHGRAWGRLSQAGDRKPLSSPQKQRRQKRQAAARAARKITKRGGKK